VITGSCLCGSVKFDIDASPITTRICWCRLCQKIGAGSATVNVGFPTASVRIHGQLGDHVSVADSGNVMHRRFCPACGVHLFSGAEARPQVIFVRAGALDDPTVAQPVATIWTSQAPAWASICSNLQRFEGQPPPPPVAAGST
jgi:hypothetical protein